MKNSNLPITLFGIMVFLIGCTAVRPVRTYTPYVDTNREIIQNYKLHEIKQVYIGDSIIEKGNITVEEITTGKYKALDTRSSGAFQIEKDHIYEVVYDDTNDGSLYVKCGMCVRISREGVILDNHPYYYNLGGWQNHAMLHVGQVGEKLFSRMEDTKRFGKDSFKIEIIYAGLDGNNLKVTYREYKDDIARPAFYQDIVYNLSKSHIIRYRNFKIEIINASNESLEYSVLED